MCFVLVIICNYGFKDFEDRSFNNRFNIRRVKKQVAPSPVGKELRTLL